MYLSIGRERFRTKPQLKKDLRRAISILSRQVILLLIYPSFDAVHIRLSELSQLAFLLVLPIMKFVMKRLVSRAALSTGEGTSKEIVPAMVSNVDVFDALFTSKCM